MPDNQICLPAPGQPDAPSAGPVRAAGIPAADTPTVDVPAADTPAGPQTADDAVVGMTLTAVWMLITGRRLGERPLLHTLPAAELMDFWADDHADADHAEATDGQTAADADTAEALPPAGNAQQPPGRRGGGELPPVLPRVCCVWSPASRNPGAPVPAGNSWTVGIAGSPRASLIRPTPARESVCR
jgi:hypothetical protein